MLSTSIMHQPKLSRLEENLWHSRSSKPAVTIREQREAAKAMTQYFRDLNAAKNAEKAK